MSLTVKLASCLCHMKAPDGGPLVPGCEEMTPKEICAAVEWDHKIARELMGSDHPSNIMPLPTEHHRSVKTPTDQGKIAEARQRRRKEEAFRKRVLAKHTEDAQPKRRGSIPSRPFQRVKRPMMRRP